MKILLVGSGGREHAIAWKLAKSEKVSKIFVAPGNGGTAIENKCENVNITDIDELVVFVRENNFNPNRFQHLKEKGYTFQFTQMPFEDISSTDLRERIKKGLSIKNLVSKEVEDYINKYALYKD